MFLGLLEMINIWLMWLPVVWWHLLRPCSSLGLQVPAQWMAAIVADGNMLDNDIWVMITEAIVWST